MTVEVVLDAIVALERFKRTPLEHVERVVLVLAAMLRQLEVGSHSIDGVVTWWQRMAVGIDERRRVELPYDRWDVRHELLGHAQQTWHELRIDRISPDEKPASLQLEIELAPGRQQEVEHLRVEQRAREPTVATPHREQPVELL
jgi:hypothetical protein